MRLSPTTLAQAMERIRKIFDTFKSCSKAYGVDVGRMEIVGSLIKKTFTDGSDIDLAIFINNAFPPFEKILLIFESILRSNMGICNTKRKQIIISFQIDNFKFDILPATNFCDPMDQNSQITRALQYVQKNEKDPKANSYKYGTAWSEFATEFVGKNSQFILDVIILAKQWTKRLTFSQKHIPSLSYMTELIVVYANRGKDEKCLRTGFIRFLKLMSDFNTIDIEFNDYKWLQQQLNLKNLDCPLPRIVDPINVWHNLAEKIDVYNRAKIMRAASLTLEKLENGADLIELLNSRVYI